MPENTSKIFKVGEKSYDIPSDSVDLFLQDIPDAQEVFQYSVGEKKYGIPANDTTDFLKDFPDAKPLDQKPKKGGVGKFLYKSFEKGSSDLGEMLSDAPGYIYNFFALPQNILAGIINKPTWRASSKKLGEQLGIENKIAQYYDKNTKVIEEEIKEIHDGYQKGIVESFKKGDIESGLMNLAGGVLESLPASMAVMLSAGALGAPGTVGVGTTLFGAGKMAEIGRAHV